MRVVTSQLKEPIRGRDVAFVDHKEVTMLSHTLAATVFLLTSSAVSVAQTDSAQPNRNDPPPAPSHQTSKDTVPPATDSSLPTRGGKQEPSSKIETTEASGPILNN